MGKFDGKVFLELGTNVASVDIVKYAKSEGAYVIVTDYLPTEKSEAKQYADETAMISTLDVEAIYEFAKEKHIDGIFCGVSEPNLLTCSKVADKLGLPFYFTTEQWNIVQNKKKFKDLCIRNKVSVPKEYNINSLDTDSLIKIDYPVIVKPVDRGAAIGIHICHDFEELKVGYYDAIAKSYCGKAVIEEYIYGQEVSCYYTFVNGECCPSILIDKYICERNVPFTPLPEAYVFPSKFQKKYLNTINDNIMNMFKAIGLKNGVACVQCIANENGIYVFECGLRIGGNALYRFVDHINGNNFMKMLVDYSLLGEIDVDIEKEDCYLKGKHGCILSMLNIGGKIDKIEGYETIKKHNNVINSELRYNIGDVVVSNGTLKQSHIRFFIVSDSINELSATIKQINDSIIVLDDKNQNMIYSRFDGDKIV